MSEQSINNKSIEIRQETQQFGNTRGRVANVIDDMNKTKANKDASNMSELEKESWRSIIGVGKFITQPTSPGLYYYNMGENSGTWSAFPDGFFKKDMVIRTGSITTTNNTITLQVAVPNNAVQINGVVYEKKTPNVFFFTPVNTGIKVLIIYALPTSQLFHMAEGAESNETVEPPIPDEALFVRRLVVKKSGVIIEAEINEGFREKSVDGWTNVSINSDELISVKNQNARCVVNYKSSFTVRGFIFATQSKIYDGMPISVRNDSDFIMNIDTGIAAPKIFTINPDQTPLKILPKQTVHFALNLMTGYADIVIINRLTDAVEIQGNVSYYSDADKRIFQNGIEDTNAGKVMYDSVNSGFNILTNYIGKQESSNYYSAGYVNYGVDIYPDFTGATDYRPSHPAHDSVVGFGRLLGKGVEDGTNFTLFGTALFAGNDMKYWDSVTAVGKGINNAKYPFNNPDRLASSVTGFDLRNMMTGVVAIGNEIWCGDVHTSTLVGTSIRTYRYIYNSVVLGNDNQNYAEVKYPGENMDVFLDNDIIIGSGIFKDPKKYPATHNLLIGQNTHYGNEGWDQEYVPLIEANFKEKYLNINGEFGVVTDSTQEQVGHTGDILVPVSTGEFVYLGNSLYEVTGGVTSEIVFQNLEIGKNYLMMVGPPSTNPFNTGSWGFTIDTISDSGNSGTFRSIQNFIATTNNPLKVQVIGATGKLEIKLQEIDVNVPMKPAIKTTDSSGYESFQIRVPQNGTGFFLGKNAGSMMVYGNRVVGIGNDVLSKSGMPTDITAIGHGAMSLGMGGGNSVAIGVDVLKKISGRHIVAIGNNTMQNATSSGWTTAIGNGVLKDVTTGDRNSGYGFEALRSVTTGSFNLSAGELSGYDLYTGSYNLYMGPRTQASSPDVTNEIVLGGPSATSGTFNKGKGSNTVKIGNSSTESNYIHGTLESDSYNEPEKDEEYVQKKYVAPGIINIDTRIDDFNLILDSLTTYVTINYARGLNLIFGSPSDNIGRCVWITNLTYDEISTNLNMTINDFTGVLVYSTGTKWVKLTMVDAADVTIYT